jgi:hypothetical protein
MFNPLRLAHARRAGILVAAGLACAVAPAVASASAVNLATASPFAVLGGSAVTNTGPSVLNGDLGVYSGTSITGFGPGIVNGTTYDGNAVAGAAQNDLTTAYNVAAGQSVSPANILTGQNLGGLTLAPGAYKFASSAQLTGALTLDAGGDPSAQFVFEIGSTLTTASASSVVMINGASPCNVYWQIGSSATLGTTTAFEGNLMASASITLNTGATLQGRALASTGAVTLDSNVVDNSMCAPTTPPPTGPTSPGPTSPGLTPGTTPTGVLAAGGALPPQASQSTLPTRNGSATLYHGTRTPLTPCNDGFTATVRGREIKQVVFKLDGQWLATRIVDPFRVHVPAAFARNGHLKARVTFKDATRAQTLNLRYQACAAAVVAPLPAPSTFTG